MALGGQVAADLVRLSQCPVHESVQHVNLADAVRSAMGELESRAIHREVVLKSHIPAHVDLDSKPVAVTLLAWTLVNHAIHAAPRRGHVTVSLESSAKQPPTLVVTDDGPDAPENASAAPTQLDPATAGRPRSLALFWAHTLAQHLGTELEIGLGDAAGPLPEGKPPRARIEVKFL
jgi:two-component sensor histidine kinase